MSSFPTLGATRRVTGRRALTPMRSRGKKPAKTRSSGIVKKKRNVLLSKSSESRIISERPQGDTKEQCDGEERKGSQGGSDPGKQQDTEVVKTPNSQGDQCDSPRAIHPGSIQGLSPSASLHELDETELKEEEPPF